MPYRYSVRRRYHRRLNKCAVVIGVSLAWIGATGCVAALLYYALKWLVRG